MAELEISPLAKRLAEENNVDWHRLSGSGDGGKVVERDVLDYLSRVMSGEEDVNPTPEPLPDGLEAWPEDDAIFAGAATGGRPGAAADTTSQDGEVHASPSVEWRTGSDADDMVGDESGYDAGVGAFDYGPNTNGDAVRDEAGSSSEEADLDEGIFVFDDEESNSPAASATEPSPAQEWADDLTDFGEHGDDDLGSDLGRDQDGLSAAGGIETGGSRERELDFDWTSAGEQEEESRVASEHAPAWDDELQEPAWDPVTDAAQQTEQQSAEPQATWGTSPEPGQAEYSVPQEEPTAQAHEFEPDSTSEGSPEGHFAWEGGTVAQHQEDAWAASDDEEELADQDADAQPSASALDDDFASEYDEPGVDVPEGVSFEEEETPAYSFTPTSEDRQSNDLIAGDGQATTAATSDETPSFAAGIGEWDDEQAETGAPHGLTGAAAAGTEQSQGVRAGSGIMLRRHTELSNLVQAQQSVANELGVDEAVVSIAFLIRAASRAGYPWPLAAGSERLGVAAFGESDISLASLDGAADMNFRELVTACASLPAADSADDAALVVADLSGLGIDEAVLDLGCPLLTLGRSIRRGKSGRVFAALGLSGPATPAQGSRFLQRVGDLLVEPVRLLL